jgi:quercetin 2,3-dioxygenase
MLGRFFMKLQNQFMCITSIFSLAIAMTSVKQIKRILPRTTAHWVGDGFHVYPLFADLAFTEEVSPFLMFDYGAPKQFTPTSSRRGVGDHPHRGMETVTIALSGEVEHGDSIGNKGVIGPGTSNKFEFP